MKNGDSKNDQMRVAIIGGGISGLSAAFELAKHIPQTNITIFEASDRLGGILNSEKIDGCLVESSADMFLSHPSDAIDLIHELGISDQLIETNEAYRRSWIAYDDQLHPIPEGFSVIAPTRLDSVLKTDLLSSYGKLRLLAEIAIPAKEYSTDVSLEDFACDRFGKEAFDRLIQPLIAGIYTADPAKLSIKATMPLALEKIKTHGSLIKAAQRQQSETNVQRESRRASGARYGLFKSLRLGMVQLINALTESLQQVDVRSGSRVTNVEKIQGRWAVNEADGKRSHQYDQIIVACPAHQAKTLLRPVHQKLCERLARIEYASAAIAIIAAKRSEFQKPLDGFGIVGPAIEKRPIIAVSCSSNKFADRGNAELDVYRVFIGGALQGELLQRDDSELLRLAIDELRHWLGFSGRAAFTRLYRSNQAMPQYHVGHVDLVEKIENQVAEIDGLELTGNAFRGVGIPACIAAGRNSARQLLRLEREC